MRIIDSATFEPRNANERDWLYNGLDCCVTLEVLHKTIPLLDNTTRATYEFSKELQAPVLEMTMRGLLVDQRRRKQILEQCKNDIATVAHQLNRIIRDGIGVTTNWRSNPDLIHLFYTVLGFKPIKRRTPDGKYTVTVNREAIEKLAANLRAAPICDRLLLLRELDKRRQRLEAALDSDGRERTNFNIGGTNTGRLASAESDFGTGGNQQNVDRDLREIYVADPGMKFANIDLEQGDARNVGAICWDRFVESHGEAFAGSYISAAESSDLHIGVAKMVWPHLDWADARKTADQLFYRNDSYRQISKKLGHATNFDGQPKTLSERARVEKKVVETFQKSYFNAFPCVKERINWVKQELQRSCTLTTLFGRRRIFFGHPTAGETQREAIAYEPQSMTAEEINIALLAVFRQRTRDIWLHLQVHDSLLLQYHEEEENEVIPWLLKTMRVPLTLARGREFCVPLDVKVGWNWGEVKKNDEGKVIANPSGLISWRGGDSRKRT